MAAPWVHEMIEALEKAGKKTLPVFESYMKMTGKSKQQLYRIAKQEGWKPFSVAKEKETRRQLYGK